MRPNTITSIALLIGIALAIPTHLQTNGENDRRAVGKITDSNAIQATTREMGVVNIVGKRDAAANEERVPPSVVISAELLALLEAEAAAQGLSLAELVTALIAAGL